MISILPLCLIPFVVWSSAETGVPLDLPPRLEGPLVLELPSGWPPLALELRPHSVRADGFEVWVDEGDGRLVPVEPAPLATLRGSVRGIAGSRVVGTLERGRLTADVRYGETAFRIAPVDAGHGSSGVRHHAVPIANDSPVATAGCGTPDGAALAPAPAGVLALPSFGLQICEVGVDADHEYFLASGSSVVATQLDVEDVVHRAALLFEPDAELTFEITTLIVRAAADDPYSDGLTASAMVQEFRAVWNETQADVVRDVAHLFTNRFPTDGFLGFANIGQACKVETAYGWSRSKFSPDPDVRAKLTAHEIGHNWGGNHCNTDPVCGIMCAGIGGCGNLFVFAEPALAAFAARKLVTGCLTWVVDPPPPVLTDVTPDTMGVFDQLDTDLAGSGFVTAIEIEVGETTLVRGPVQSDFLIVDDTRIVFDMPPAEAPGEVDLRVASQGGPSAPRPVTFTFQDPPAFLHQNAVDMAVDDQAIFRFAALPGSVTFWNIASDSTTIDYLGYPLLIPKIFVEIPLDANGMGIFEATVPASFAPPPGVVQTGFISQALFADPFLQLVLITGPAQTIVFDSERGLVPGG